MIYLLYSLVAELLPEKHPVDRPPWRQHPPGSLICHRSSCWHTYKVARSSHGRQSPITVQALLNFNAANADVHNFQHLSQASYESSLVHQMKEKPKLFHAYIRHKKVGHNSVGPLRIESGELCDMPDVMSESFSQAFSSVYTKHTLPNPALFQHSVGFLSSVPIEPEQIEVLLNAIDPSTAMGLDCIHPQLLKSCSAVLSYPLSDFL